MPDLGLGARHFPEPSLFGAGPGADGAAQLLKCTVRFRPTEGSAEATAASPVPVRRRKRVGAGSPPGVCRAARHRAPPGRWRTAPRVFHESLRQPSRSRCGRRGLRGLLTSQPPIHRVPWAIAIADSRVAPTVTRSRSLYGAGRAWRRTAPAAPRRRRRQRGGRVRRRQPGRAELSPPARVRTSGNGGVASGDVARWNCQTTIHWWFVLVAQVDWSRAAPLSPDAPATSRHFPLLTLVKVT